MSARTKILLACAAAAGIILPAYLNIRLTILEEGHVRAIVRDTNAITALFRATGLTGAAVQRPEEKLESFVKAATGGYPRLALCAVADRTMATRMAGKNDRYLPTTAVYDAILQDFMRDRITVNRERPFVVRYYGGTGSDEKYYLFVTRVDDWRLLAVWPRYLDQDTLLRVIVESGFIIFIIALGGLVVGLIAVRRRAVPLEAITPAAAQGETGETTAISLNLDQMAPALEREDAAASRDTRQAAGNTLREYVIGIFKKIDGTYAPETVSLYLRHSPERLSRSYELKGHSFLTYDVGSFDHIELASDVGRELTAARVMVMEGGRSIVIPLLYREQIIAAVTITRPGGFSGAEINAIGDLFAGILKELNDFLVVSEVMIDPATGLHSKSYFAVKYRELAAPGQGPFAVVMADIFHGLPEPEAALASRILKILIPTIRDGLPATASLYRHDGAVAALVPGLADADARARAAALQESLARYQIKISETDIMRLSPRVAAAVSTDTSDPLAAVLAILAD